MANRQAAYKDDGVVSAILSWWMDWRRLKENPTAIGCYPLDIYSEYITDILECADFLRLQTLPNYSQFIKCLHSAHIVEFAPQMWRYLPDYEPSIERVRRMVPSDAE